MNRVPSAMSLDYQLGQIGRVNVADIIRRSVAKFPDRTAIADLEQTLTYSELDSVINRVARGLLDLGVKTQGFVAILSGNRVETLETYLACARAGLIAVPINPMIAPAELEHILSETTPKIVVTSAASLVKLASQIGASTSLTHLFVADDLGTSSVGSELEGITIQPFEQLLSPDDSDVEEVTEDRMPVQCLYTSGTTSMPKGVLASHLAITFTSIAVAYDMRLTEQDVTITPFPLNHVAGLNTICTTHLLAGAAVHLRPGWNSATMAAEIEQLGITNLVLAGPMWVELAEVARQAGNDLSSLQTCIVGMASLLPERAEPLRALAPNANIVLASGMTEFASWQCAIRPEDQITKALSWGSPGFMNEVAIMNEAGRLLEPNVIGEIVYRGPTAMNGYLGKPAVTAELCRDGWFRTGDVGYLDEEHVLWFVDRTKDMIKTGGENVASLEVSDALFAHPDVADCAVVGLPHERWSEAITAFVKPVEGSSVTSDELVEHCRNHLTAFKVPKAIVFVEEFPRTSSGKIQKAKLRETFISMYAS